MPSTFTRTLKTLHYAIQDPVTEKLPHVHVPTLIIRGTKDSIAPQRWVEEMVRLLPRGRLLVIPGATHVANYTAGDIVARAVRDLIREHDRPAHEREVPVIVT